VRDKRENSGFSQKRYPRGTEEEAQALPERARAEKKKEVDEWGSTSALTNRRKKPGRYEIAGKKGSRKY